MRNIIAGFIAIVIGLFTVSFAAIMALFIGVAAFIAKPFIQRKMAHAYSTTAEQRSFDESPLDKATPSHDVIDGECEDITVKRKF
ncbi:hypothetical protein C9J48_10435 [Photobacterium profundum]|uniref:Uncharacterized protein n=1 Tax=Photobacterium profundum 3TCK TaxID=314280 RepID=Q1YX36_9GAMM|nr:hypothetical protein [Photobacterium profundum]EAS40846.1 hypothetical protein P3TCK_09253 [Photobacterium profundum 3TCK]PSV62378.1 hypothetical protein C9J48_10435 [Photobacterium profundum]